MLSIGAREGHRRQAEPVSLISYSHLFACLYVLHSVIEHSAAPDEKHPFLVFKVIPCADSGVFVLRFLVDKDAYDVVSFFFRFPHAWLYVFPFFHFFVHTSVCFIEGRFSPSNQKIGF